MCVYALSAYFFSLFFFFFFLLRFVLSRVVGVRVARGVGGAVVSLVLVRLLACSVQPPEVLVRI